MTSLSPSSSPYESDRGRATPRPRPQGAQATPQRADQPRPKRARDPRDLKQDEILRRAFNDSARAREMLDQMQQGIRTNKKRQEIQRSIAYKALRQSKAQRPLIFLFYANFAVLGLVFFLGAGVNITAPGVLLTTVARICALTGTYLLLVQLLLVGRLPALDRLYGMDKLTRWHKVNGHIALYLILAHAVLVVVGNALLASMPVKAMSNIILGYHYMIPAVISLVVLCVAIFTSVRQARRKMGHNKWFSMHKWTYIAVVLSFGHELYGPDFVGRMWPQAYIWALYLLTFAALGYYRLVLPILRTFLHQLRVSESVDEGGGCTSLYITGLNLDRMRAKPGQFCYWRFLSPHDWREAHPYSLSAAPNHEYLRITIKKIGDASSRVAAIPLGTWVTFEGPFGRFTPDSRTTTRTVLVAGGVGITPIRSLLEGMPSAAGDISVIYRANKIEDAVFLGELEQLAAQRHAELHVVLGERQDFPAQRQPLSPAHIRSLVPDIGRRDVFICAPPGMTQGVRASLKTLGLRSQQVHHETFA